MQMKLERKYSIIVEYQWDFPNVKGKHNLSYLGIFNSNSTSHRARPSVFMSLMEAIFSSKV